MTSWLLDVPYVPKNCGFSPDSSPEIFTAEQKVAHGACPEQNPLRTVAWCCHGAMLADFRNMKFRDRIQECIPDRGQGMFVQMWSPLNRFKRYVCWFSNSHEYPWTLVISPITCHQPWFSAMWFPVTERFRALESLTVPKIGVLLPSPFSNAGRIRTLCELGQLH